MSRYFSLYPQTFYTSGANNVTSLEFVTNIISRFKFSSEISKNSSAFYKYTVKDSDTPEIIASKFYGDSEKHWIVLMFNNIVAPQYDWPLEYSNFINFVNNKYAANGAANTPAQTGLAWAQNANNIQSYYQIITRKTSSTTSDTKTVTQTVQVDSTVYANISLGSTNYTLQDGAKITETVTKKNLTFYQFEDESNEAKKEINLLKQEFVPAVFDEFKTLIKQ